MNKKLKENFEAACNAYLSAFCARHEMDFEGWVGGRVGEVAEIGDRFIGMDEMRYDVDNEPPKNRIFQWLDYMQELCYLGCTRKINFEAFCKGAPLPYSHDDLMKIKAAHKKAEEARKALEECIKNADSSY